jgi:predicted nucleotidyltransferase
MDIIPRLQTLAAHQPNLAALWLYGSRARGDHHEQSDFDLAVAFTDWEPDPLERRLRPELLAEQWRTELALSEGILSVVDIAIAPIPLGLGILADGKLLVDSHPQVRMSHEARILSRWELDYSYLQALNEAS